VYVNRITLTSDKSLALCNESVILCCHHAVKVAKKRQQELHTYGTYFDLIECTVFQVQEGLKADMSALVDIFSSQSLSLFIPIGMVWITKTRHGNPHKIHIMFSFGQLSYVQFMPIGQHSIKISIQIIHNKGI